MIFFREKCTYKTTYKEECSDKKQKVCEKFWKEDGYGGKVWTEDPSRCHWLQESECTQVPHPVKVIINLILNWRRVKSKQQMLNANNERGYCLSGKGSYDYICKFCRTARMSGRRCASQSTRMSPCRMSARCAEAWRRAARSLTPNTMAIE